MIDDAEVARFAPAAREAVRAFPIAPADITPVSMSENITFRVTDARDGAVFALRLHRPGYHTLAELDAERAWTAALDRAGVGAPVGLAARDGGWYAPVATAEPAGRRFAGVTRWVDGEILAGRLAGAAPDVVGGHFRRLGATAAALHNQASAWIPPAGFDRHALDAEGLVGAAPFWGPFWDSRAFSEAERRVVLAARARIADALGRLGRHPAIFSLIHADLHPGNVLTDGDGLTVIDFDDAAFGWHAFDIAVAIFSQWTRPGFAAVRAAFLSGYRAARALDRQAEALIPMFLLIRGLMLFGWLGQRPEIDPAPYQGAMKAWILERCAAFEPPC